MRKIQRQHWARSFLYSWPVLALLAFVAALIARPAFRSYEGLRAAEAAYAAAHNHKTEIESRQADLEQRVSELSTPGGLEKELRERYGLRKPGEETVFFVDRPAQSASSSALGPETLWDRLETFLSSL